MRIDRRIIILLAAALIAGFTTVVVRNKLSQLQKGAVVSQVSSQNILLAKRDVPAGKFVDAARDLEWANPPSDVGDAEVVHEGAVKKNEFNGGILRRPLKAGKPVTLDAITKAGDGGFLSAVLESGMRAVSIAVTATTGAAGFIAPGDRVDLIVTHRIRAGRSEGSDQDTVMSETFVRDVRVVAVDQSIDSPENKAQLAKNVTVEVTESQAEQIAVAIEMGKISLALRSSQVSDPQEAAVLQRSTRSSDVISSLGGKSAVAPRVQVIRGDQKEELQFLNQGGR